MSEYVIVTDSAGDIPQSMVEEYDLSVLPLRFHFGEATYEDHPDRRAMPIEAFYDYLRAGEMPTTSAVNVGDFHDAMRPVLESGKDVLVLAFTSALSTTYQSAVIAAEELQEEFPERKVLVVDTLCASLGQALLVWYAANMQKEGKSIEEVRDWAEAHKGDVISWFTVNDLHHLKRGGRISATTAVVGSMLQIKPILHVSDEGKLVSMSKARGRAAALKGVVDTIMEKAEPKQDQMIFICHSDCLEEAQKVGEMLKEKGLAKAVEYGFIGPVIGAHTGPGTIGVFAMGTER